MTAEEFGDMINSGHQPWKNMWSDSSKEQYFNLLNNENANKFALELWNMNNEYNTPSNQLKRLVEAGLNPALAYGSVSPGNSGSPAQSYKADTAKFHDTQDKLATINTIMSGISDIMSTIESGVGAVKGIQDVSLVAQNNWYDKMRSDFYNQGFSPWLSKSKTDFTHPVEIAPGLFADSTQMQVFPELYEGFKSSFAAGNYHINESARQDQHALVERRNRIDGLIQKIFQGLEHNASTSEMIRYFMELMAYSLMQTKGGGF